MTSTLLKSACTALLLLGAATAMAQPTSAGQQKGNGEEHEHRGPPPQAIAACNGKAAGAACSFTGRENQSLTGTCFSPPPRAEGAAGSSSAGNANAPSGNRPMACRPARRDGPPPQ